MVSRRRGGGKHTDEKSKAEERQAASAKRPEPLQVEVHFWKEAMLKENRRCRTSWRQSKS